MFTRRFTWSGLMLGFALGGFFDGILLHQILQWHHLLSGLESDSFRDVRVQILADGAFHALMYVVAALGLWLLLDTRRELAAPRADRVLIANMLVGFGVWHIVDTLFSHWLTGIHRIRMDSDTPLFWDLLWVLVFGLGPLLAGTWMRRGGDGTGRGSLVASALAALVVAGGVWASRPPPGASQVMVFFRPGMTPPEVFAAADTVSARVIWSDKTGGLWAFDLPDPQRASALYRHGALFVGNSLFAAGCLAWSRAS